jgi:hypothetical protein
MLNMSIGTGDGSGCGSDSRTCFAALSFVIMGCDHRGCLKNINEKWNSGIILYALKLHFFIEMWR